MRIRKILICFEYFRLNYERCGRKKLKTRGGVIKYNNKKTICCSRNGAQIEITINDITNM